MNMYAHVEKLLPCFWPNNNFDDLDKENSNVETKLPIIFIGVVYQNVCYWPRQ